MLAAIERVQYSITYCLMKSDIQEELASGTFLQAKAQALSTKSFTDSLYVPFESSFNCFRTLREEQILLKR